ncbi:hypothetical protein BDF19DRAFT_422584 [Syncephalis fuscata]|nr:hypothetical protein BDF19DRAFT_422584 [Syncephalis fuscata]
MPLIVFGDAVFDKQSNVYKGHRSAVVNRCWQMLKRREHRGDLVAIKIDENLSSEKIAVNGHTHHTTLVCQNCQVVWNRPAEFARPSQASTIIAENAGSSQ